MDSMKFSHVNVDNNSNNSTDSNNNANTDNNHDNSQIINQTNKSKINFCCSICKQSTETTAITHESNQNSNYSENDGKFICVQCQTKNNKILQENAFKCICSNDCKNSIDQESNQKCNYCRSKMINGKNFYQKSNIKVEQDEHHGQQQLINNKNNNVKTIKQFIFLSPNSLQMFSIITRTSYQQTNDQMIIVPKTSQQQQIVPIQSTKLLIKTPAETTKLEASDNSISKKKQQLAVNAIKKLNRLNRKIHITGQRKQNLAKHSNPPAKINGNESMANKDPAANRFINISLIQNPIELEKKLSEALVNLDSNRISKYRCPLEELYHNWTFFIDHISMIYWSCFGQNFIQIELFIHKFWSFMNNFLSLYRLPSEQINDHAVIKMVHVINQESLISINQCLLLNIFWLKFNPFKNAQPHQQQQQNLSEPWYTTIINSKYFTANNNSNKKVKLLIEALNNIGNIADKFHVNDIELALISTIFLLKHSNNLQCIQFLSNNLNNDNNSCHICYCPMLRLQQLFIIMLELFIDDNQQTSTAENDFENKSFNISSMNGNNGNNGGSTTLIQLMFYLSPELEYLFSLLNV